MYTKSELETFLAGLLRELNEGLYNVMWNALEVEPELRRTLMPVFPFPREVRVGLVDGFLLVEHVGPEQPGEDTIAASLEYRPDNSLYDFLGIPASALTGPTLPCPTDVTNMHFFLGESVDYVCDYFYDFVAKPQDMVLNGFFDLRQITRPTFVSNSTIFWSDEGHLRIRRIDFLEVFPLSDDGVPYHSPESLPRLALHIIENLRVPRFDPRLHGVLNEFIELISTSASEPEITKFLADHPEVLQLAFGAHDLNSETLLEWQIETALPNLKPDFMPVRMDGFADIVEFKLPRLAAAPMTGSDVRQHPTYAVDSAIAQVDQYADWCQESANVRWLEQTHGIKVLNPELIVVMGHSKDFSAEERRRLRGRRNARILTYDEFIDLARFQLYRAR